MQAACGVGEALFFGSMTEKTENHVPGKPDGSVAVLMNEYTFSAGEEHFISHSSMSQQIKALEDDWLSLKHAYSRHQIKQTRSPTDQCWRACSQSMLFWKYDITSARLCTQQASFCRKSSLSCSEHSQQQLLHLHHRKNRSS